MDFVHLQFQRWSNITFPLILSFALLVTCALVQAQPYGPPPGPPGQASGPPGMPPHFMAVGAHHFPQPQPQSPFPSPPPFPPFGPPPPPPPFGPPPPQFGQHSGMMQSPPQPKEPEKPPERPRNHRLLTLDNSDIGEDFEQFVANNKHRMPACKHYRAMPGTCDPELDLNPCVACLSGKHVGSFANSCPSEESFSPNVQGYYEWQFAGTKSSGKFRQRYICIVRQKSPDAVAQAGQEDTFVPPPAPSDDNSHSIVVLAVSVIGIIVVVVGIIGVVCLVFR